MAARAFRAGAWEGAGDRSPGGGFQASAELAAFAPRRRGDGDPGRCQHGPGGGGGHRGGLGARVRSPLACGGKPRLRGVFPWGSGAAAAVPAVLRLACGVAGRHGARWDAHLAFPHGGAGAWARLRGLRGGDLPGSAAGGAGLPVGGGGELGAFLGANAALRGASPGAAHDPAPLHHRFRGAFQGHQLGGDHHRGGAGQAVPDPLHLRGELRGGGGGDLGGPRAQRGRQIHAAAVRGGAFAFRSGVGTGGPEGASGWGARLPGWGQGAGVHLPGLRAFSPQALGRMWR